MTILYNKIEQTTDTHNMNESHRYYADQKSRTKESIVYDSIYI